MPGDQTLSPPMLGAIFANMLIDLMLPQTSQSATLLSDHVYDYFHSAWRRAL